MEHIVTCVTEVRGQHKSVSHAFQLPLHVIVINLTWVGDSVLICMTCVGGRHLHTLSLALSCIDDFLDM